MIIDHVLIEAKRLGMDLVCPMFDGALFAAPSLSQGQNEETEMTHSVEPILKVKGNQFKRNKSPL